MKTNKQNTTTLFFFFGGGGGGGVPHNLSEVSPKLNSQHNHHCAKLRTKLFLFTIITIAIIAVSSCGVKAGTGGGGITPNSYTLQQIISNGNLGAIPGNTDPLVTNTLAHLTANYSATITAIYVTETGSGDYSGTNWNNAIVGTNLRSTINNITNASATKVYAVLVAGGTYKPTDGTDRTISFSMKNHVAIIGGFAGTGSWELTGTTTFSGNIGTANDNSDNTYHVFDNNGLNQTAVLYGVTISGGRAGGGINFGGGMYNTGSSPRLFNVVFSDNSATTRGGGMYNFTSSPVLTGVVFSNNSALGGGGMHNQDRSDPVLIGAVFTGNSATQQGGGMYNFTSSPVLTGVVFSNNSATEHGGGMYNQDLSAPVLIGAVFTGNSATQQGGGMYNNNDGSVPLLVNTIFAGNTASGIGQDIAMNLDSAAGETIRIAGSVLGITLANPTNGIVAIGNTGTLDLTYHSLANTAVNFGATMTTGGLTYPTIQSSSGAVDVGLYVRRSGTDYYFSENTTSWYTNFTATGGFGTAVPLPGGAEDLTARDIAGNPRVGRPDAGVYEVQTP